MVPKSRSALCVQTWFRKWRSCEMTTMVALLSFSTFSSQRMVLMSRLLVGSSSNRMSGLENSACVSSTRSLKPGAIARIGIVTAHLAEPGLQFGGVQVVLLARLRVHINGVLFLHHPPHLGVALHHHVEYALVLVAELVLTQPGHAFARIERDVAGGWFQFASQDLHEGRLAAAVGADQAIAVAIAELDVDVLEQWLGGELQGDAGSGEHGGNPETQSGAF